jgi:hypothetical protein
MCTQWTHAMSYFLILIHMNRLLSPSNADSIEKYIISLRVNFDINSFEQERLD